MPREKLDAIEAWVSILTSEPPDLPCNFGSTADFGLVPLAEVPFPIPTVNRLQPGKLFFTEKYGILTEADRKQVRESGIWTDCQFIQSITDEKRTRLQPESSEAAIGRYEEMCHDNGSLVSEAATWGTEIEHSEYESVLGCHEDLLVEAPPTRLGNSQRNPSTLQWHMGDNKYMRSLMRRQDLAAECIETNMSSED